LSRIFVLANLVSIMGDSILVRPFARGVRYSPGGTEHVETHNTIIIYRIDQLSSCEQGLGQHRQRGS